MAENQIRYDMLVKDALRSVIKKVLSDVAKNGLPDNHHFFITFLTEYNGVKISPRLKKLYPQQMTIVLQHQFWGLKVNENFFEVTLSFSAIPETLVIPFKAIQTFLDPVASFETTFDMHCDASNNNAQKFDDLTPQINAGHIHQLLKLPNNSNHSDQKWNPLKSINHTKKEMFREEGFKNLPSLEELKKLSQKETPSSKPKPKLAKSSTSNKTKQKKGADVVSLDAFRKNKE